MMYRSIKALPQEFHRNGTTPIRRWVCDEEGCEAAPDAPMLKDEVWNTISHKKGILCIKHAEQKLGRQIHIKDLRECVANNYTFLLYDRMSK